MKVNLSSSNTLRKDFKFKRIGMNSILAFILVAGFAVISEANWDELDESKQLPELQINEKVIKRQERSDLSENEQNIFTRFGKKPKKKHLDRDYLMKIMGNGYDTERLSEEEPAVLSEISSIPLLDQIDSSSSWTLQHAYKELMELNFTLDVPRPDINMSETIDMMRQWLFKRAICPIYYTWKDIGPYFWPRWLKIGECDSNGIACSWPPGMHCIPAETTTVQVLRWHCSNFGHRGKKHRSSLKKASSGSSRNRKNWRKTIDGDKKCQWIKVPYPVISACICQC